MAILSKIKSALKKGKQNLLGNLGVIGSSVKKSISKATSGGQSASVASFKVKYEPREPKIKLNIPDISTQTGGETTANFTGKAALKVPASSLNKQAVQEVYSKSSSRYVPRASVDNRLTRTPSSGTSSNISSLAKENVVTTSSPKTSSLSTSSFSAPNLASVSTSPTSPRLPSAPSPTNFNGLTNSYTTQAGLTNADGTIIPPTPEVPEDQNQKNLQGVIEQLRSEQPERMDRQAIMKQAGLVRAQKEADDLKNRINAISAQAQSNILQLRGTAAAEGVTEAVYGGQQAQIERETAIKLMPLTAQYEAAVGNVEAAKEIVANFIADENAYQNRVTAWKNDLYNKVWDIATASQKTAIEDRRIKDKNEREDQKYFLDQQGEYIKQAIENGQGYLIPGILKSTNLEELSSQASKITGGNSTGGNLTDAGKPMNDTQATSYGYAQRLESSDRIIDQIGSKFTGAKSYLGALLPNVLKTEDRQKFEQAKRNFVNAVLRRESGAVISEDEFDNAQRQYFPQPGDSQGVLAQKNANRSQVIQNLYRGAGVSGPAQSDAITTPEDFRAKYNY